MSNRVANDVIYDEHGAAVFVVSTINRASSALAAHGSIYAETMVWTLTSEGKFGRILDQDDDYEDSVRVHNKMVEKWARVARGEDIEEEVE
jgi:hypothetical protein